MPVEWLLSMSCFEIKAKLDDLGKEIDTNMLKNNVLRFESDMLLGNSYRSWIITSVDRQALTLLLHL